MNRFAIYGMVLILVAGIGVGGYFAGYLNGKLSIARNLAKKESERQAEVTRLTIQLAKTQKQIDEQTIKTVEVIRHVKDLNSCADVAIPGAVADLLR